MKKLLYIYTTWCRPCIHIKKTVIEPLVEAIGSDRVIFIDAEVEHGYVKKYRIHKVPTLIIVDDGGYELNVDRLSAEKIKELLEQ